MQTIHKFPLKDALEQQVSLPYEARILSVQEQNGELVMWAQVNILHKKEPRKFMMYDTGQEVNEYDLDYITTVQRSNGLVVHVFENK